MGRKVFAFWLSLAMVLGFVVIVDVTIDFVHTVGGTTLYVNTTGTGGAYTSIQDAINDSKDGDTVFVYNGTYFENVVVNKTINLTGEDKDSTIIDSERKWDTVKITSDFVNITRFTIMNSSFGTGDAGLLIDSNYNTITDNNFSTNFNTGIYLSFSIGNTITNNMFLDGGIFLTGDSLENWNSHNIDLSNSINGRPIYYMKNQIGGTVPINAGLVILANCTEVTIENHDFKNVNAGVELGFSFNNSIINNSFSLSQYGIYIMHSYGNNITGNNFSSITFTSIYLIRSDKNNIAWNEITMSSYSIYGAFSSQNRIKGNNISHNNNGIYLAQSSLDIIMGNNISFNKFNGIRLTSCNGENLSNNMMEENGIFISGILLKDWNQHSIDISNTVNGKPVYYWNNETGGTIPSNAGQVILANCTKVRIENQEMFNGTVGIVLGFCSNIEVTTNNVSNHQYGFYISNSNGNNITFNNISWNNEVGIHLDSSSGNNLTGNNISSNYFYGIRIFFQSNYNILIRNIFSNSKYGVRVISSYKNMIYHNNIINNTNYQAYDGTQNGNQWDDSYPSGGNYWSDYSGVDNFKGPNQDQPGSDGIGDTNYTIDSDSIDNYPLIEPYTFRFLENYIILKQGWNLISIPLIQVDQKLTKVLELIDGYYDAVQWYDIRDKEDPWKHHKVDKPFGNDLFEIKETTGFWIHITQPGDTIFLYNGTQPTSNQTIALHPGWNLVGYPSLTSYNRSEGLNNLTFDTHIDAIWTYNATTQKWKGIGPSDYFEIGRGYWVHAKVECEWVVPL